MRETSIRVHWSIGPREYLWNGLKLNEIDWSTGWNMEEFRADNPAFRVTEKVRNPQVANFLVLLQAG